MKIILVRHGEAESNVAHIINDDPHRPVSLTGRGREQAEEAAQRLRAVPFTHAYASEFLRAQQTAGIILRHHDCPLRIDARLNERRTGLDGQPVAAFNELVRPDPLHIRPAGGETFLEQMERLRGFMDEVAARHPDGVVLAVSHENPIVAALALTVDDPEQVVRRNIANCEAVGLEWRANSGAFRSP